MRVTRMSYLDEITVLCAIARVCCFMPKYWCRVSSLHAYAIIWPFYSNACHAYVIFGRNDSVVCKCTHMLFYAQILMSCVVARVCHIMLKYCCCVSYLFFGQITLKYNFFVFWPFHDYVCITWTPMRWLFQVAKNWIFNFRLKKGMVVHDSGGAWDGWWSSCWCFTKVLFSVMVHLTMYQ